MPHRRRRMPLQRIPHPRRTIEQLTPAIRATLIQRIRTIRAERTFERTDERPRRIRRQINAAAFAIRTHFQHRPALRRAAASGKPVRARLDFRTHGNRIAASGGVDMGRSGGQTTGMTFDPHSLARVLAILTAAGPVSLATPAAAQEMPAIDYDGALDHARTTGRLVRQAQQRERRAKLTGKSTPHQVEACAGKATFRRQFGADHPKVRKLYQLCRQVGL